MRQPDRVSSFADAWNMYSEAIEILDLGKHRIASEVAWGSTKQAPTRCCWPDRPRTRRHRANDPRDEGAGEVNAGIYGYA